MTDETNQTISFLKKTSALLEAIFSLNNKSPTMVRTTNFGQRRNNEHFIVPPLAKISFHLLMARPIMIYFLHTKFICMIYKVLAEKLSAQIFLISKFW